MREKIKTEESKTRNSRGFGHGSRQKISSPKHTKKRPTPGVIVVMTDHNKKRKRPRESLNAKNTNAALSM